MKKYLTGFLMAWGNFCSLPCPVKRWDSNHTSLMLGFLPLIGLVIGIVWAAAYFGLVYLGFPFFAVAFLITFLPFALCGFMHMDGFMDCCDAIMSRRPLEDRQRILKDSNTGAFAVVSMIFLVLGYFCFLSTAVTTGIDFVNMIMIVVVSRSVAGLHVLICRPMQQSQYAAMQADDDNDSDSDISVESDNMEFCNADNTTVNTLANESVCECELQPEGIELIHSASEETYDNEHTSDCETVCVNAEKKTPKKSGVLLLLVLIAIIAVLAFLCSSYYVATALVVTFTAFGSLISIQYAKKNLAGMSGDIAGFGIVWGELIGVFALILC